MQHNRNTVMRKGIIFKKKPKTKQQQYTDCKLIVGVYRSFPHGSGVVETLHVVGFVEAAVGRQGQFKVGKWGKNAQCSYNKSQTEFNVLLTDLIIWSGTGLFFRRGGISSTGCTVKHWMSGAGC